jgi:hypothetical protein
MNFVKLRNADASKYTFKYIKARVNMYHRVTLIYDHYGSLLIRNKHIKALKEAGASKLCIRIFSTINFAY